MITFAYSGIYNREAIYITVADHIPRSVVCKIIRNLDIIENNKRISYDFDMCSTGYYDGLTCPGYSYEFLGYAYRYTDLILIAERYNAYIRR
jgi:hypothetical protein